MRNCKGRYWDAFQSNNVHAEFDENRPSSSDVEMGRVEVESYTHSLVHSGAEFLFLEKERSWNGIRSIILCRELTFILTTTQYNPVGVNYYRVWGTYRLQGLMTDRTVWMFTAMKPTSITTRVGPRSYQIIILYVLHQYAVCVCVSVCFCARTPNYGHLL